MIRPDDRPEAGQRAGAGQVQTIRGRRVRVKLDPGQADRTPLLLLSGIGAALDTFDPFVTAMAGSRTVIRIDLPGVGGSPVPPLPYHYTTLAPLISGLLDRLDCPTVDLLGISWGGGLAQQLAVQRRSRIRRLVLVATGTGMLMIPGHPRVLARMLSPRRHRDARYAAEVAGLLYGGSMRTDPDLAIRLLQRPGPPASALGYALQLLAGMGWTSLPILPLIRQPALLMAGDDDPIVPVLNATLMGWLMPHARVHIYPGGHLSLLSHATVLAPVVEQFLDDPTPTTERPR
jgi:poly(3-hydroxyalkanoate) depolymerase